MRCEICHKQITDCIHHNELGVDVCCDKCAKCNENEWVKEQKDIDGNVFYGYDNGEKFVFRSGRYWLICIDDWVCDVRFPTLNDAKRASYLIS